MVILILPSVLSMVFPFGGLGRSLFTSTIIGLVFGIAVHFFYFTFYENRRDILRVGHQTFGYGHDHLIRKEDIISAEIRDKTWPWQYLPFSLHLGSRLFIQGSGKKILILGCKGKIKKAVVSVDEDFDISWLQTEEDHLLPSQPTT